MSERQGIEIDYCPKCRGIWLDRGELDKIIEKSLLEEQRVSSAPQPAPAPYGNHQSHGGHGYDRETGHGRGEHGGHGGHGGHGHDGHGQRRHGSFLSRLFD